MLALTLLVIILIKHKLNLKQIIKSVIGKVATVYHGIKSAVNFAKNVANFIDNHQKGQKALKELQSLDAKSKLTPANNNNTNIDTSKIEKSLDKVVENSTKSKLSEAGRAIEKFTTIAANIVTIGNGTRDVYRSFKPSQEQKTKSLLAKKEYDIVEAELALNACLVDNKRAPRDKEGMPAPCEQAIDKFVKYAGDEKFHTKKEAFNKRII